MNETVQTLMQRRSCRAYEPRQVDEDTLQQILAAGTYAPSGKGRQSTKIVVLQDPAEISALEAMNAAVMGQSGTHPFYGAPTVCVVLASADVPTCVEDGALVIGNLMNAAWSLGVGSCWIHRAREEFASAEGKALLEKWGISGNYIGVGHCILGYAAKPYAAAAPRKEDFIVRV